MSGSVFDGFRPVRHLGPARNGWLGNRPAPNCFPSSPSMMSPARRSAAFPFDSTLQWRGLEPIKAASSLYPSCCHNAD